MEARGTAVTQCSMPILYAYDCRVIARRATPLRAIYFLPGSLSDS